MTTALPRQIMDLHAFDGPFDARRLTASGCDVLFASYPAGTVIDEHQHATDNVGVITTGALHLTVDGVERTYAPGEWYHVPPNTPHAARFDRDTTEIELWFAAG